MAATVYDLAQLTKASPVKGENHLRPEVVFGGPLLLWSSNT
jgi:hypothetical protein